MTREKLVAMLIGKAKELKKNGNIETIEKNGIVTASTLEYADPPSWGLDRIDQEALPLDQTGTRHDATGVKVYILDTGLRGTHQDLSLRKSFRMRSSSGTSLFSLSRRKSFLAMEKSR